MTKSRGCDERAGMLEECWKAGERKRAREGRREWSAGDEARRRDEELDKRAACGLAFIPLPARLSVPCARLIRGKQMETLCDGMRKVVAQ